MRRSCLCLLSLLAIGGPGARAQADEPAALPARPLLSDPMPLRFSARASFFARRDHGYYDDARVFSESGRISADAAAARGTAVPLAAGLGFEAGVMFLPRLSLFGSYGSETNGINNSEARISWKTQRLGVDIRYVLLRAEQADNGVLYTAQIEASAGIGYYLLKEDFINRALPDRTFLHTDHSVGVRVGLDASAYIGPVGGVVGYAYHVAQASVTDSLGARLYAGGHELSVGLALRF